ncbi:MAG: hypothetical protein AMJ92_03925 [candidate division Zixibacteria bacterium SM23_81]|nr:MAG: hypothetical protein AMJ92_03925 [candidate division Zixibacteria bacterium SM23_81]
MSKKIKVLYIAGLGRSGSTILDKILGEIDGFFSVGEMNYIWDRGLIENRVCACGVPFRECKMWKEVLCEAFGALDRIDAQKMQAFREKIRTRHTLLGLLPRGKRFLSARLGKYPNEFQRLYQAVQSITGSKIIIDSSKFPSHAYLLKMLSVIDLYVIHLIRDPRAITYSWQRKKFDPGTGIFMPTLSPLKSSLSWLAWNVIIELLWNNSDQSAKYMQVHYQDFVTQPKVIIENIVRFVGESPSDLPFISKNHVDLAHAHAFSGNPTRFHQGKIQILPDTEWHSQLKLRYKILTTLITWPLLMRYRYALAPRHPALE